MLFSRNDTLINAQKTRSDATLCENVLVKKLSNEKKAKKQNLFIFLFWSSTGKYNEDVIFHVF